MSKTFQLDIVTAETEIFSGLAEKLFVTGVMGELEILYNHAPLLTRLSPGPVWVQKPDGTEEGLVIFGGTLEVQPDVTIILADTAIRASDVDEAAAEKAKQATEQDLAQKEGELNYAKARSELTWAVAQLRLLKKVKKGKR